MQEILSSLLNSRLDFGSLSSLKMLDDTFSLDGVMIMTFETLKSMSLGFFKYIPYIWHQVEFVH